MDILQNTNFDFMKYRKFWVLVSFAFIVAAIVAVFFHGKLNVGIDFAGGTQLTVRFAEEPEIDELRDVVAQAVVGDVQIQRFGAPADNSVLIKTPIAEGTEEGYTREVIAALESRYNGAVAAEGKLDLNRAGTDAVASALFAADPEQLKAADADLARAHYTDLAEAVLDVRREQGIFTSYENLSGVGEISPAVIEALRQSTRIGQFAVPGVENVGPQVGEELRQKGLLAVVLSMIGMLIYIWVRFELRFGVGAMMSVLHDVIVVLGLYAFFGFEFNLTTIAAFLTLIGYSVNDTVVVFDRVRENLRKNRRQPFVQTLNDSLNQTLSRTILTGGSTLLACLMLFLFGGEVIRGFAFVLMLGIIVGTYSSLYIASPFALLWEETFARRAAARKETGGAPPAAKKRGGDESSRSRPRTAAR